MAKIKGLELSAEDRAKLEKISRKTTEEHCVVQRARILLEKAGGLTDAQVAARLGVSRITVSRWVNRYRDRSLEDEIPDLLRDEPRSGRRVELEEEVERAITTVAGQKPAEFGLSQEHWTVRTLTACLHRYAVDHQIPRMDTISVTTVQKCLEQKGIRLSQRGNRRAKGNPGHKRGKTGNLPGHAARTAGAARRRTDASSPAGIEVSMAPDGENAGSSGAGTSSAAPDEGSRKRMVEFWCVDEKTLPCVKRRVADRPHVPESSGEDSGGSGAAPQGAGTGRTGGPGERGSSSAAGHHEPAPQDLFAAVNLVSGSMAGIIGPRYSGESFIGLLKLLDSGSPRDHMICIVCDNAQIHKSRALKKYLNTVPDRFGFMFIPKRGSGLNLIEGVFVNLFGRLPGDLRGDSPEERDDRIMKYLDRWNQDPVPPRWMGGFEGVDMSQPIRYVTLLEP